MTTALTAIPKKITPSATRFLEGIIGGPYSIDSRLSTQPR